MPWNEPGGGGKDPWNSKKKSSSSSNQAADKVTELFEQFSNGGGGKLIYILPVVIVLLWAFSGIYTIDAAERGVVLQFGKYKEITTPGIHWIARPFQAVEVVNVDNTRVTDDRTTMLTKDENIVDLAVEVQYVINDPKDYLFNVMNPDYEPNQAQGMLYQAMRSSVREVVGRNDMDYIIKDGRAQIESETHELLQGILNRYKTGLTINKINLTYAEAPKEVKDAFDDANRAREDFNRSKNRAETYANKVLPEARGKAARALEEASAYKSRVISKAEGDASRFTKLAVEYAKAPEVTRQRLYLDTMETVLSGSKKILLDTGSGNNVFYLPIGQDNGKVAQAPVPPPLTGDMQSNAKQAAEKVKGYTGSIRQARDSVRREGR